ncbi:hypothetical protein [Pseudomonas xanthosomatis]|uniref:hypothetical protein n=1 Tax=Pseudomonas xanthosomatis TaxID=2842356 RepID=UPI003511213A
MKKLVAAVLIGSLTACSTPKAMNVPDGAHKKIDTKVGLTDQLTINKCVSNMVNTAPAERAENIRARHVGGGKTITVAVEATLVNVGMFNSDRAVGFQCEYKNGLMVEARWIYGL